MISPSTCGRAVVGVVLVALLMTTGVSAAQEARGATVKAAPPARAEAVRKKPGRVKWLALPPAQPRYKCEDDECVCKGVLDCKSLIDSGFCTGRPFWQDAKDPSVGGC